MSSWVDWFGHEKDERSRESLRKELLFGMVVKRF